MKRILQRLFFWRAPDFVFSVRCSFGLHRYGPIQYRSFWPVRVEHFCQDCPYVGRPSVEKVAESMRGDYAGYLDRGGFR